MNKICNKCKIDKPEKDFYNKSNGRSLTICKSCIIKKTTKYNLENPRPGYFTNRNKEILNSWRDYFPKSVICPICGKEIFFSSGDKTKSICFDHRHGGLEAIKDQPTTWLVNHRRTLANEKIWESCNFGMLCGRCNLVLPTLNRDQWLVNVTNYVHPQQESR